MQRLETLLVHRDAATNAMPRILKALHEQGVELRGCAKTCEIFGDAVPASDSDWAEEYLAPILAVRVVDDIDSAIEHIRRYGSNHTEVIVTRDYRSSQEFLRRIGSSTVGVQLLDGFSRTAIGWGSAQKLASRPRRSTLTGQWDSKD